MNKLAQRRRELGLTQPEVSEALKVVDKRVDVGVVSRYETGLSLPTPAQLAALESALQAPASALYDPEDLFIIIKSRPQECKFTPHGGMTQNQTILRHLQDHGHITSLESFGTYRITRLSARIYDLRRMGYEIISFRETKTGGETVNYARYILAERSKNAARS